MFSSNINFFINHIQSKFTIIIFFLVQDHQKLIDDIKLSNLSTIFVIYMKIHTRNKYHKFNPNKNVAFVLISATMKQVLLL